MSDHNLYSRSFSSRVHCPCNASIATKIERQRFRQAQGCSSSNSKRSLRLCHKFVSPSPLTTLLSTGHSIWPGTQLLKENCLTHDVVSVLRRYLTQLPVRGVVHTRTRTTVFHCRCVAEVHIQEPVIPHNFNFPICFSPLCLQVVHSMTVLCLRAYDSSEMRLVRVFVALALLLALCDSRNSLQSRHAQNHLNAFSNVPVKGIK